MPPKLQVAQMNENEPDCRQTPVAHQHAQLSGSVNLDFLRSAAVIAVYVNHVSYSLGLHGVGWISFAALGRTGVLIFFVHTSLVLMMSLQRLVVGRTVPALQFYVRRAFRIYPLSVFCIIACLMLHAPPAPWESHPPQLTTFQVVSNLLLTQNLTGSESISSPMWSLPYEVQMYILLPCVFVLSSGKSAITKVILQMVAAATLFTAFWKLHLFHIAFVLEFIPCFLAGVLAFALTQRGGRKLLSGTAWALTVLLVLLVGAVILPVQVLPPVAKEWLLCAALGALIPRFFEIRSAVVARLAQKIAQYSYGIYLSHVPIMWVCLTYFHGPCIASIVAAGVLSIIVPVVLYHFVEAPMISLGKVTAAMLGVKQRPSRVLAQQA